MRVFGRFNLKTLFLLTAVVACLCSCYRVYSSCHYDGSSYNWKLSEYDTLKVFHKFNFAYIECKEKIVGPHIDYVAYNGRVLKCHEKWTMHNEYFFHTIIDLPSFEVRNYCQHAILGKSRGCFEPGEYYQSHTVVENIYEEKNSR